MASVFSRGGTREHPHFFARYRDAQGKWRSKRVLQQTKREALRVAAALEAKGERQRLGLEAPDSAGLLCRDLMKRWSDGLTNRSARDDRSRLRLHVLPQFGGMRIGAVTLPVIMEWLDAATAARRMSSGTLRHCLNLVSRFFAWCIDRGYASANVVRQIPSGRRPRQTPRRRPVPWIQDDAIVRQLMAKLPEPADLILFVGNRCGLRVGEILGLRMSDVDNLAAGAILVRHSFNGPLKEDRHGVGKSKWAPAPSDAPTVLGPWIERRRAAGASGDDFLFADEFGRHMGREWLRYRWERATDAIGLSMTLYAATRHSFVSRNLSRGVPLDEVSGAVGHSTPAITMRAYNHYVRREFSPLMTAPLSSPGDAAIIPIGAPRAGVSKPPGQASDDAGAPSAKDRASPDHLARSADTAVGRRN